MQTRNLLFRAAFALTFSLPLSSFGQQSFSQLEDKIYQLNNAQKFTESQALLLPVLTSESYVTDEKYQAAVLLSYTYKRVSDYQSTLKFLRKARQFAQKTRQADSLSAYVTGQEALAHFDINQYTISDSLMTALEKTDFRYIDLENKAKLVMQQGYLRFKEKQYAEAEALYDRALVWLRASSPCDLPMILVKKMQLYAALNRMDLLKDALRLSSASADSCGIIKYHIYAYEELLVIYKARKDANGIAATTVIRDSLNSAYQKEVQMAALHNQQESIIDAEASSELDSQKTYRAYLLWIVGVLLAAGGVIGYSFWRYRQRKEREIAFMKHELKRFIEATKHPPTDEPQPPKTTFNVLSDRQRDVLDYMARGLSNKEIADQLFISENTVKYHIKNIYLLLEIKDRKSFLANMER